MPRTYSLAFLFENRIDPDTLLFAGRTAIVVVSILLALLVWRWARELYGTWPANVALGLYAFNPDILAHSTLAMLDLGLTAGIAIASYTFWRALKAPSVSNGLLAGFALAIALLIKSTAVILLALMPIELYAAIVWHRSHSSTRSPNPTHLAELGVGAHDRSPRTLVIMTAITLFTALCLVAAAYGPYRFGLSEYVASFRLGFFGRDTLMDRDYEYFCWGQYSKTGFPWYFFAAFLLKMPIPMLLATAAIVAWIIHRRLWRSLDDLFLILPIAAFFLATTLITDDLGIRYLLPVYPLLFILAGGMAAYVWRQATQRSILHRRIIAWAGATLATAYVAGTLWIYPNYLSFFNGLIVGPANGIHYLDDSNIDLGQDFKQLAEYLHQHKIPHVKGVYRPMDFVPYLARYYGVVWTWMTLDEVHTPSPGWYAVSVHLLQRPVVATAADQSIRFDWLKRFEPAEKIGYSIYLYHFDRNGMPTRSSVPAVARADSADLRTGHRQRSRSSAARCLRSQGSRAASNRPGPEAPAGIRHLRKMKSA